MADGDVALDGEGDSAVDGAHQRHVNHLADGRRRGKEFDDFLKF